MTIFVPVPGPVECWTCRHHAGEFGECRIARPTAAADHNAIWPRVSPIDFCGDHQRLYMPEGTPTGGATFRDPTGRTVSLSFEL